MLVGLQVVMMLLSIRNLSLVIGDLPSFLGCFVMFCVLDPYWIYIIPTHDMHEWLLLQFLVLLMMYAESVRNM